MIENVSFDIDDCVMVDHCILGPSHYAFVAHLKSRLLNEEHLSVVAEYRCRAWQGVGGWTWQSVAIAAFEGPAGQELRVLGRDGQLGSVIGQLLSESSISSRRTLGPFRGMQCVDGRLLAYGMRREVYERLSEDQWRNLADGFDEDTNDPKLTFAERKKRKMATIGGINSMILNSHGELIAVGMRGEIWCWQDEKWNRIDSPTNIMLTDGARTDGDDIYLCGLAGTVLRGDGRSWEIADYDRSIRLDFTSICFFKGKLYLADGHSLRVFDGGTLSLVNFGVKDVVPCARLIADVDQMLATAGQEVWVTGDGAAWECILG